MSPSCAPGGGSILLWCQGNEAVRPVIRALQQVGDALRAAGVPWHRSGSVPILLPALAVDTRSANAS